MGVITEQIKQTEKERESKMEKLTARQQQFVKLEKQREAAKQVFADVNAALSEVVKEIGTDKYFQDEDGTVYKTTVPKGRWVEFETVGYLRTRRPGEDKGSLSAKEAETAGFKLNVSRGKE